MLEIVAPAVSEAALNYMATSLLSFFSSQQSLESSLLENAWDTNLNFFFRDRNRLVLIQHKTSYANLIVPNFSRKQINVTIKYRIISL
jgi:hypothetical protein